jgi:5,10-methylene-tetrahydrofolate dehydrogenase/methenyl tetrahydrofolate cyclohydrolase
MIVIDGNALAESVLNSLRIKVKRSNHRAGLGVILIGNNPESEKYVAKKKEKHWIWVYTFLRCSLKIWIKTKSRSDK